jgi:hypothetical protein
MKIGWYELCSMIVQFGVFHRVDLHIYVIYIYCYDMMLKELLIGVQTAETDRLAGP